jgi:hypothetical protein
VRAGGSGPDAAQAVALLEHDPVLGTLTYDVRVTGAAPADVHAVVLRRATDGQRPAVVARLTGPGVTADRGTLALSADVRARLEAGELELVLVTRDDPGGVSGGLVHLDRP